MKYNLWLTTGLVFISTAYAALKKKNSTDIAVLGNWGLSSLEGDTISPYPHMELRIAAGGNRISAFAVCNSISGTYVIKPKTGKLQFPHLSITWNGCKDRRTEKSFLDVLRLTTHYKTDGNHLTLFHYKAELATFVRK